VWHTYQHNPVPVQARRNGMVAVGRPSGVKLGENGGGGTDNPNELAFSLVILASLAPNQSRNVMGLNRKVRFYPIGIPNAYLKGRSEYLLSYFFVMHKEPLNACCCSYAITLCACNTSLFVWHA